MGVITQAFFDRLSGDATLTGLLGTFNSSPSIFTKTPLPNSFDIESHAPYVVTTGQATDDPGPNDTKNSGGKEIIRDVRCYDSIKSDPLDIEAVAERIRELFHRYDELAVSGYDVIVAAATGPIEADEEDALGRIVSVRLVMSKT